jgi:hypothetical protein
VLPLVLASSQNPAGPQSPEQQSVFQRQWMLVA